MSDKAIDSITSPETCASFQKICDGLVELYESGAMDQEDGLRILDDVAIACGREDVIEPPISDLYIRDILPHPGPRRPFPSIARTTPVSYAWGWVDNAMRADHV